MKQTNIYYTILFVDFRFLKLLQAVRT